MTTCPTQTLAGIIMKKMTEYQYIYNDFTSKFRMFNLLSVSDKALKQVTITHTTTIGIYYQFQCNDVYCDQYTLTCYP